MIIIFAKDSSPNDSIPVFIWRRIFGKEYNHSKYYHQINLSSFHLAKNRTSKYLFFSSKRNSQILSFLLFSSEINSQIL